MGGELVLRAEAIRRARASIRPAELAGHFGDEANGLFEQYRTTFVGKRRTEVDPQVLHDINERLHEVLRQMDDLDREFGLPGNRDNVQVVIDNLKGYEREFTAITEARKKK